MYIKTRRKTEKVLCHRKVLWGENRRRRNQEYPAIPRVFGNKGEYKKTCLSK
jgi:hypothetical protein